MHCWQRWRSAACGSRWACGVWRWCGLLAVLWWSVRRAALRRFLTALGLLQGCRRWHSARPCPRLPTTTAGAGRAGADAALGRAAGQHHRRAAAGRLPQRRQPGAGSPAGGAEPGPGHAIGRGGCRSGGAGRCRRTGAAPARGPARDAATAAACVQREPRVACARFPRRRRRRRWRDTKPISWLRCQQRRQGQQRALGAAQQARRRPSSPGRRWCGQHAYAALL